MSRKTVVVVEDEPLVRSAATDLFSQAGITVVAFGDGDAAMDYLRDHKDDVAAVFTDVDLPGETDGLELASIVSQVCPEIAVLVTSGHRVDEPDGIGRGPGPGVRYVQKPWRPADVLHTVRGAVRDAA